MWFSKNSKVAVEEKEEEDVENSSLQRKRGPLFTPWILEALSLLASMGCIIAIMVILSVQNNKPIPNWHGITLNGVVSVLSDLAHAALMYPVSEAIGQLKWVWYWNDKKPRRLTDFDVYNCATRGPFGSLWLLFKPRLWHFSSLGALLTIAALAMQFFLQLMPNYESQQQLTNQTASLARCMNYTDWVPDYDRNYMLSNQGAAAIYSGLYNISHADTTLDRTCDTGNCTWPIHQSLGICSACANVSELLNVTHDKYPPHGKQWQYGTFNNPPDMRFYQEAYVGSTLWTNMSDYVVLNPFFMYFDVDSKKEAAHVRPNAFDCSIYWCVRTYNVTLSNGKLSETLVNTWPNASSSRDDLNRVLTVNMRDMEVAYKRQNYTFFQPPGGDERFNVTSLTTSVMSYYLGDLTFAQRTIEFGRTGYSNTDQLQLSDILKSHGPAVMLDRIAQSISIYMRNKGQQQLTGNTYAAKTFVTVRWEWAILPLTLLGVALAFVLVTAAIGARRNVPVWKNSSLPSLVYPLDDELVKDIADHGPNLSSLERRANGYSMAMMSEGYSWKLQGHAIAPADKDSDEGSFQRALIPSVHAQDRRASEGV